MHKDIHTHIMYIHMHIHIYIHTHAYTYYNRQQSFYDIIPIRIASSLQLITIVSYS